MAPDWLPGCSRLGQLRSTTSTKRAAVPITCSQLSRISKLIWFRRWSVTMSMTARPGTSRTPRVCATTWGTSSASVSTARSISHTPSTYSSDTSAATRRARRVLPHPPAPVKVSSRDDPRSRLISSICCSRPMKRVVGAGRLFGLAAIAFGGEGIRSHSGGCQRSAGSTTRRRPVLGWNAVSALARAGSRGARRVGRRGRARKHLTGLRLRRTLAGNLGRDDVLEHRHFMRLGLGEDELIET